MNNIKKESKARRESKEPIKSKDKEEEMISTSSTGNQVQKRMNMNAPSWLPQTNPLLIHLILDATMSHLPLKDLLSCRLVCQFWSKMALPIVKEKSSELIFFARGKGLILQRGGPPCNNFISTMKKSLEVPCGKFQLQLDSYNPDLSTFSELIDVCSSGITCLHITSSGHRLDANSGPDHNKETFQNWLKQLKHLKKLTINDFDFGVTSCSTFFEAGFEHNLENLRELNILEVRKRGNLSSGFFDGFFTTAKKLEKMMFGVADHGEEYNDVGLAAEDEQGLEVEVINEERRTLGMNVIFKSLMNHGSFDGIKSLNIHYLDCINLAALVCMGKKGLRLDSFTAQGAMCFGTINFYEFLETQKTTLKTLVILQRDTPETLCLKFPSEMKELWKLSAFIRGPVEISEPICYKTRFPKLRKFQLQTGREEREGRQDLRILDAVLPCGGNGVGCETLEEFKMIFMLSSYEGIDIREINGRLSRIFPKLRILVFTGDGFCEEVAREMTLSMFSL